MTLPSDLTQAAVEYYEEGLSLLDAQILETLKRLAAIPVPYPAQAERRASFVERVREYDRSGDDLWLGESPMETRRQVGL